MTKLQLLSKSELRQTFSLRVAGFSDAYRLSCSLRVCEQLVPMSFETVGLYCALSSEIDLSSFFKQSVCVPRFNQTHYEWVEVSSLDQCVRGAHGVLEPPRDLVATKTVPKIVFVPGVAFDRVGHRLGRGMGYYDRLLKNSVGSFKIGVAFDEQISKEFLPNEPHDVKMDALVTPTYFRFF